MRRRPWREKKRPCLAVNLVRSVGLGARLYPRGDDGPFGLRDLGDIADLSAEEAGKLIMTARAPLFDSQR